MTRETVIPSHPELRSLVLVALVLCAVLVVFSAFGPWVEYTLVTPNGTQGVVPGLGSRFSSVLLGLGLCLATLPTVMWKGHDVWWFSLLLAGFAFALYLGVAGWVSFERREFEIANTCHVHIQPALIVNLVAASAGAVLCLLQIAQGVWDRLGPRETRASAP